MNREELTTQVNIGINAEKLLNDELLSGLFFSRKNQACQSFMETSANDDKARRDLWQSVQGALAIEQELHQLVESGILARDQLKSMEEADNDSDASVHNFFEESK